MKTEEIRNYLVGKGLEPRSSGKELIAKCPFCDKDRHFYVSSETGQFQCKRCGEEGNMVTLAKYFGDDPKPFFDTRTGMARTKPKIAMSRVSVDLIDKCHKELPRHIRSYLNSRGLSDDTINRYKLGYSSFYERNWITIPVFDAGGDPLLLKLRRDPDDKDNKNKFKFYPLGSKATIYGWENLANNEELIVVCEGEFDRLVLEANGIPAITSTGGAGTFKEEWLDSFTKLKQVYICFDKDEAGDKGAERLAKMLADKFPEMLVYKIPLPEMEQGKDITDYFVGLSGNPDKFMFDLPVLVAGKKPIDVSKFKEIGTAELAETLELTIKRDNENKIATFLCELSAYTEDAQFNISFNAPSSTGKSYIPTEIARLFPKEDVIELGQCSPTAFFHDVGKFDKERKGYIVDLSRKVLIFLDQPHAMLLERLRPLLSHDQKEMQLKITDKSQRHGLRTKTVFLKGYPAVIFCSAGLKIDEQEATRFLLLSPETSQEKIRESIQTRIKKEADSSAYRKWLDGNADRLLLKERIEAIKREGISDVKVGSPERISDIFKKKKFVKPRHSRDVGRLMSLIKALALLNLWFREREGDVIVANDDDLDEALRIWETLSESQEMNLPPFVLQLYRSVILPVFAEKNGGRTEGFEEVTGKIGVNRQEIAKKHQEVTGTLLADWQLRQQIIPMLETAGLIYQEPDQTDKRKMLIYPTT